MAKESTPLKILVVDDEVDLQRLVTLQFRREIRNSAVEFSFALDGSEALDKLDKEPGIEIILCDINMPGMDGLTLLSILKKREAMIKTIMVTAYDNMNNIRAAMNSGAFDFVTKPIDFSDLKTTIQKASEELEQLKAGEEARKKLPIAEKALETTSEKAKALEELNQLKTRFFTNISHEFRTPLTVIMGMSDQIQSNPGKWLEKGNRMIKRNTGQLLDLVNQILDLRKLEVGQLQLNLHQADIVYFLENLTDSFRFIAETKQQNLSFKSSNETLMMDFDSEKLLRIISNLLSNAVKFTPEGGEILVDLKSSESPNLQISITDNGVGIPTEELPQIFDRFYQVDDSSTRENEGTGIGLSLVKELTQLMNGEIKVESTVGVGTTFHIKLPIAQNAEVKEREIIQHHFIEQFTANSPKVDLPLSTDSSSKELPSLLIIEDNRDVVEYLMASLEDHYSLLTASNGQEGIDIALEQVPDLIISDVMMPIKDGFEVCKMLKADQRTSHIPIILLTAKADHEARIEGLTRGADAYLAKPFNPQELFIRLEKLLQLRRNLRTRYANLEQHHAESSSASDFQQEDDFINEVQKYIHQNLTNHSIGLKELCDYMGMSRSNLHRKITALTGLSSSLYIRRYRLQLAKELLLKGELQISEIAYEVGFSDPAYFSRSFTKEFGISPRKLRKGQQ